MSDGVRFEAWTLPESGSFDRKVVLPVTDYTLQVRNSKVGGGTITIPDDFAGLDQVLTVDPDNHANDEASLIRAFRGDQLLAEFYALRVSDTYSDGDPTLQVSGDGIEHALDRMRVLPYDYTGTGPTVDPDWIYGAPSILDNTDFDTGGVKNELQSIWNDSTTGTFTLTDGTDTTSAIAYNASAATIKTRLETDIASISQVDVTGTGSSTNPWVVEFANPADPGYTLSANDAGMDGTSTITVQTPGGSGLFGKWYQSTNPVTGLQHGVYDEFAISTAQAHSGTYSLKIDAAAPIDFQQWPGAQQIIKVQPGKTYRAEVWLYSTSSTDLFRLVMRDLQENLIATTADTTLTASTWTKLTIGPFVIPDGVTSMIFRFAYVGGGTPAVFYADDALLAPGLPQATLGEIFGDLLDDLNTHLTVGSWLTRTFTDTLDSDGNTWDRDLQWGIKRGQSLLQLLEYAARWGYEFRIRWTGTAHALDLFNPGGMGTDYSSAATPAIAGRVTGSGPLVRRAPDYTWILAEGDRGHYGVSEDTTLSSAWAKWMGYWPDKTGRDSAGLAAAAAQRITDGTTQMEGFLVRVEDPTTGNLPLEDILIGDKVQVMLPGKLDKGAYRTAALTISSTSSGSPVYEWHLSSQVFTPEAAVAEGVNQLIRKFQGLEDAGFGDEAVEPTGWGPGVKGFTIRVAASDAYPSSIAAADLVCDGVDDEVEINQAIASLAQGNDTTSPGRLLLSEGQFNIGSPIIPKAYIFMQGMGINSTTIRLQNGANCSGIVITFAGANGLAVHVADLTLDGNKSFNSSGNGITYGTYYAGFNCTNVWSSNWAGNGFGPQGPFSNGRMRGCKAVSNTGAGFYECFSVSDSEATSNGSHGIIKTGANWAHIVDNICDGNGGYGIANSDPDRTDIVGNYCYGNTSGGIFSGGTAFGGSVVLIVGNRCDNNSGPGIILNNGFGAGSDHSLVASNVVVGNSGWGIDVSGGGPVHVAANMLTGNTSGDINLGTGKGNTAAANYPASTSSGSGYAGADTTAIHDNVAAEISAITAKATPTTSDYLVIEDAADSDNKKAITIGNLPAATPATHAASHHTGGGDAISHDSIDGVSTDDHHTEDHAARHADGGADELDAADLASATAGDGDVLTADGTGGAAWVPARVGADTIADTSSTVNVTHGLGATPSAVLVTPGVNELLWVTAIGATTFTVNRSGTSGAHSFSWRADT